MVNKIIIPVTALLVATLIFTSCALHNAEDAGNGADSSAETTAKAINDEEIVEGFTVENVLDGHFVSIKKVLSVPVGEGEGKVGGYATPGHDYCVSNISFTEDGGICVTDTVGKKLEIYSQEGEHLGCVSLDPHDGSDRKLYYAAYTEYGIYAIYDHTHLYRFDGNGGIETLDTSGDYYFIDAADDGSVYLYSIGYTSVCAPGGKPEICLDYVPGIDYKKDKENMYHIIGATCGDLKGVLHEFKLDLNEFIPTDCPGILNDLLVLLDIIPTPDGITAPVRIITAYRSDGETVFSLSSPVKDNELIPPRHMTINNGKLYMIICTASEFSVYEITCT